MIDAYGSSARACTLEEDAAWLVLAARASTIAAPPPCCERYKILVKESYPSYRRRRH